MPTSKVKIALSGYMRPALEASEADLATAEIALVKRKLCTYSARIARTTVDPDSRYRFLKVKETSLQDVRRHMQNIVDILRWTDERIEREIRAGNTKV